MSWPIASVRGSGRDKAGLARSDVLLIHLVGEGRKLCESVRTLPACRNQHARGVRTKTARKEKQLSM